MNCSPNYIVKMLLKLQLILQANSEWVEISQQHYRKPLRTTSKSVTRTEPQHYFETSTRKVNRIYMNNSFPETNRKNGFIGTFPSEVLRDFAAITESPYAAISERPDFNINKYTETRAPANVNNKKAATVKAEDFKMPDILTTLSTPKEANFNKPSDISLSKNDHNINDDVSNENAEVSPNIAEPHELPSADSKANALQNVIKLVKIVADTITKNTHRSVNSKMKYLRELKNTILKDIETRIETLWPDDASSSRRVRRSQRESHVEFPSSESALMTISFLTFAVFLVKLVLQLIQTYKNKAMMVNPVFAAVGRTVKLPNNGS